MGSAATPSSRAALPDVTKLDKLQEDRDKYSNKLAEYAMQLVTGGEDVDREMVGMQM